MVWSVNMQISGGVSGHWVKTREEAIRKVEEELERFLATDTGKDDPQMWVPDQRSMQLRYLRERDPERFNEMIEALRRGEKR